MARPLLTADPAPTVLRWGWFLWVSWAVVGTGLLGEDRDGGFLLGVVLSAPFWALWLLWPVYRAWALWTRAARRSRGQEWQGNYYEFEGRAVRVLHDADGIWFAADDAFDALGLDDAQRDAERHFASDHPGSGAPVFSPERLAAWLDRRSDAAALRFREWAAALVSELSLRNPRGGP
jgi:hypothetical protein